MRGDYENYGSSYDDDGHAGRNPAFISFLVKLCGLAALAFVALTILGV